MVQNFVINLIFVLGINSKYVQIYVRIINDLFLYFFLGEGYFKLGFFVVLFFRYIFIMLF